MQFNDISHDINNNKNAFQEDAYRPLIDQGGVPARGMSLPGGDVPAWGVCICPGGVPAL